MNAKGKTRITISASYSDGDFLCKDRVYLAETLMRTFQEANFSVLELHIVVPSREAEQLMRGILTGETELLIEKMSPLISPD